MWNLAYFQDFLFVLFFLMILIPVFVPWFGAGLILRLALRRKGAYGFMMAAFAIWVVAVVTLSVLAYTGNGSSSLFPAWVTVILGSTGGTACLVWIIGITNYEESPSSGYLGVVVGSVIAAVMMLLMILITSPPLISA